jgi:hypothetical protein
MWLDRRVSLGEKQYGIQSQEPKSRVLELENETLGIWHMTTYAYII